jgi:hypothetical protein
MSKFTTYGKLFILFGVFLIIFSCTTQKKVSITSDLLQKKSYSKEKPLTQEQQIQLAKQRHLSLQDKQTQMRLINDVKMTNYYYDKQKQSKFAKWIAFQKFKLKRKFD